MKNYMVTCDLGGRYLSVYHIEMPDDYTPHKEGKSSLKEKIIAKYAPKERYLISNLPFSNDIMVREGNYLSSEELKIVAISRTDL